MKTIELLKQARDALQEAEGWIYPERYELQRRLLPLAMEINQHIKELESAPVSLQAAHDQVAIDCLNDKVMHLIGKAAAYEHAEPFGHWHQGETYDESEFYLGADVSGDCENCVPLYRHPKETT